MNKLRKSLTYYNLAIVILLALNILIFLKLSFFAPQLSGSSTLVDFDAYYKLLGDAKEGANPYTVDYMQTLGPPLVFAYFIPYSFFNLQVARSLFTLVSVLSGFVTCILLARKCFPKNSGLLFLALNALLFSSFPARFSIELGQPNLIATFFVAAALTQTGAHKKGFSLAVLLTIKTFFIASVLVFARKNQKTLIIVIAYFMLFFVLTSRVLNPNWYAYYFREKFLNLVPSGANAGVPGSLNYYSQSLATTLNRIGLSEFYGYIYAFSLVTGAGILILTGILDLALVLSVVLSPVVWQHYFVVLFPVFVATFFKMKKGKILVSLYLLAILMWWVEFPQLHNTNPTVLGEFLASHYFISALLLGFLVLTTKPKT